jgi:hypothetical protein
MTDTEHQALTLAILRFITNELTNETINIAQHITNMAEVIHEKLFTSESGQTEEGTSESGE